MTMAEWLDSISLVSGVSAKEHIQNIERYVITTKGYSIAYPEPDIVKLQYKDDTIQLQNSKPIVLKYKDDTTKTKTGSSNELR